MSSSQGPAEPEKNDENNGTVLFVRFLEVLTITTTRMVVSRVPCRNGGHAGCGAGAFMPHTTANDSPSPCSYTYIPV